MASGGGARRTSAPSSPYGTPHRDSPGNRSQADRKCPISSDSPNRSKDLSASTLPSPSNCNLRQTTGIEKHALPLPRSFGLLRRTAGGLRFISLPPKKLQTCAFISTRRSSRSSVAPALRTRPKTSRCSSNSRGFRHGVSSPSATSASSTGSFWPSCQTATMRSLSRTCRYATPSSMR